MRYFISIALLFSCFIAETSATKLEIEEGKAESAQFISNPKSYFRVKDLEVSHLDSRLRISFNLDAAGLKPGRDRQVMFTPILKSMAEGAADSVALTPISIAGRNRYYSYLRNGVPEEGVKVYEAGKKSDVSYLEELPWEPWMSDSYIYMREETRDCCKPLKPLCDTPVASITTINRKATASNLNRDYIVLTGDSAIELEAQGSAFVDFIVNRTEIRDNYRKNPRELKKIIESIDKVRLDPDATITRLTIKGFASPEGSYENNVRLAMGRTESLKEYVRKMYDFDEEIMFTNYEPEDWAGLRRWLETCTLPNRNEIISIVESNMAPDPKDAEIKRRFPKDYKLILDSVYPGLRHSDYTVRYKIRTFVDIDELKDVYRKSPERLRPVDFYRIAETYPKGSEEFENVLLKASEIHPFDQQAAINAANILMRRGDLQAASERISRGGETGEAWYTRGMLALINEDFDRAANFFSKASEMGVEGANERLKDINGSKSSEIIQYYLETKN